MSDTRIEFKMTEAQQAKILEAGKSVPYLVIGGQPPMSRQERANMAWEALGKEMGFKYMTVCPVLGKPNTFFTAEPIDE